MNLIIAGAALILLGLLGLVIVPAIKFLCAVLVSGAFVFLAIATVVAGYWPLALLVIGIMIALKPNKSKTFI